MITSEKVDIACNYSKLQYSTIDTFMFTNKLGTIDVKDKFIIMYDMSYTLSLLENICGISKESGFTDADLDENVIMRLTYGMLNTVAHYRHYVTTKIKRGNVVVLYSSDPQMYVKYNRTFTKMSKILNLFKKTIFIERLEDETKFIYQHIAYFTAMNISSLNISSGDRRCRIVYVGNNPLAAQMLRIDRDMISIKHGHIDCGSDIIFKSDIIHLDDITLTFDKKNTDLITSILSVFGFKHGYPRLESIKKKKTVNLYNIIYTNCINGTDKDNCDSIINGLDLSDSDKELFKLRLRNLDVDFHNKTYSLSKTLLKIWSSKIDTKAIHSFNDFFEFDDMKLNIQWLMGQ